MSFDADTSFLKIVVVIFAIRDYEDKDLPQVGRRLV